MSTELRLPRLGETMEEGIVVTWNLSEGESFERGDTLLEVETDKMVAEVPALESGTLLEILVEEQSKVKVGDIVALIDPSEKSPRKTVISTKTEQAPSQNILESPPISYNPTQSLAHDEKAPDLIRAIPGARRLAKRYGIDLKTVIGTGPAGRIERSDVVKVFQNEPSVAPPKKIFGATNGTWRNSFSETRKTKRYSCCTIAWLCIGSSFVEANAWSFVTSSRCYCLGTSWAW